MADPSGQSAEAVGRRVMLFFNGFVILLLGIYTLVWRLMGEPRLVIEIMLLSTVVLTMAAVSAKKWGPLQRPRRLAGLLCVATTMVAGLTLYYTHAGGPVLLATLAAPWLLAGAAWRSLLHRYPEVAGSGGALRTATIGERIGSVTGGALLLVGIAFLVHGWPADPLVVFGMFGGLMGVAAAVFRVEAELDVRGSGGAVEARDPSA